MTRSRVRMRWAGAVAVVSAALFIGGCEQVSEEYSQLVADNSLAQTPDTVVAADDAVQAPLGAEGAVQTGQVLATLDGLPVKGRAPKTGYDRDQFGASWSDAGVGISLARNGCDTRNDILRRDLQITSVKEGSHDCVILTGVLDDVYTNKTIDFVRGKKSSTAVQIDHVVPLSLAWQTGAQQLSAAERLNLANDPRNLQAVDGPANGQKSDGDAATWLPPNKAYRCTYVARQVEVKAAYGLWVTAPEKEAISRVLDNCA